MAEIFVTWRNGGLWWHMCVPITFPSCSAYLSVSFCPQGGIPKWQWLSIT